MKRGMDKKKREKILTTQKENTSVKLGKIRIKLRTKLFIGFAVPVTFIFALGIISYQLAADAMVKNYENNSIDVLNANTRYLTNAFSQISSQAVKIISSDSIGYYLASGEDKIKNSEYRKNLQDEIKKDSILLEGIRSIYLISDSKPLIQIGNDSLIDLPYEEFISTTEDNEGWFGEHSRIDRITEGKYGLSYVKKALNKNVYVIIDIDKKYLQTILDSFYQSGAIATISTKDREELHSSSSEVGDKSLISEKIYDNVMNSKEISGFEYISIGNEEYLFTYSKVGDTGIVLSNLIQKKVILQNATSIGMISVIAAIIAALIALVVGTILARGIGRAIQDMRNTLESIAQGSLDVQFKTKRKDEFKILEFSIMNMIENMRQLVQEVSHVGKRVNVSAKEVSKTSYQVMESSRDIALAINEVAEGSTKQVQDTEVCLHKMTSLSEMIQQVYVETSDMEKVFHSTKSTVDQGILIVNNLNSKAKATSQITKEISMDMNSLAESSRNIEEIVLTINEIAEQTNLLSLNASIESARVGDAGKGFAVVASEIRKLAEKSADSANQIQEIINTIIYKTNDIVITTNGAKQIVSTQEEALEETIAIFDKISMFVEKLFLELNKVKMYTEKMEVEKAETLDSIQNIAAVSQESAASSQEVSATTINQSEEMNQLTEAAMGLSKDAKTLLQAIERFSL